MRKFFQKQNKREISSIPGLSALEETRQKRIDFQKKRKKNLVNSRIQKVKEFSQKKFVRVPFILGFLVLIFSFLINNVEVKGYYEIKKFEIYGAQNLNSEELLEHLGQYESKSMLEISREDIESGILQEFEFAKEVYVRKLLPGTIEVELVEFVPEVLVVNFTSAYLVDSDGQVIYEFQVVSEKFTDAEIGILNGELGKDSQYVKERYLLNIDSAEERESLDWETVTDEVKQKFLDSLILELQTKLQEKINFVKEESKKMLDKDLDVLVYYQSESFQTRQYLDVEDLDLSIKILKEFEDLKIPVNKLIWSSSRSVEVHTESGKKVIFTSSEQRNLESQVQDLKALVLNGRLDTANVFDLRTKYIIAK